MRTRLMCEMFKLFKHLPTKWSNTVKQFMGKLLTNCLTVFDYFLGLALKVLMLQV